MDAKAQLNIRRIVRKFEKEHSVFAKYKDDSKETLRAAAEVDFEYSKFDRMFSKDPPEVKEAIKELIITKYYKAVKDLFIKNIATENFPNIGWMNFIKICRDLRLMDRYLKQTAVDQLFILVNYNENDLENNPAKLLCRYEFLEIFIRMGIQKYLVKGQIVKTKLEAVKMMFEKILNELKQRAKIDKAGYQFRRNQIYQLGVGDCLGNNEAGLFSIHRKYRSQRNHSWLFDFKSVQRIVKDIKLKVDPKKGNSEDALL